MIKLTIMNIAYVTKLTCLPLENTLKRLSTSSKVVVSSKATVI